MDLIPVLGTSSGEENGLPPVFLPGKSMDRGTWQATVHGIAKNQTQLSDWAHAHIMIDGLGFKEIQQLIFIIYHVCGLSSMGSWINTAPDSATSY